MKAVFAALLGLTAAASVSQKSSGIDYKALNEGNHWRKQWPEGVDNGDDDAEVMDSYHNFAAVKPTKTDPPAHTWHTYEPHTTTIHNQFQDLYTDKDTSALPTR